jgi:hypothetical protein
MNEAKGTDDLYAELTPRTEVGGDETSMELSSDRTR